MPVVEGNIGCGKSTLLNKLPYTVYKERIDDWPLDLFYSDRERWAFALQLKILQTTAPPDGIAERSPSSAFHVFWKYMVLHGVVNDVEDSICTWLYSHPALTWEPDMIIYLRASPEKCFRNISKRHQVGDDRITFEYVCDIHALYEEYIRSLPPDKVHIVDAEQDENEVYNNVMSILGCPRST